LLRTSFDVAILPNDISGFEYSLLPLGIGQNDAFTTTALSLYALFILIIVINPTKQQKIA